MGDGLFAGGAVLQQVPVCYCCLAFVCWCGYHLSPVSRELLASEDRISVPRVIPELTTLRVLTTELVEGVPLDECCSLPQETRNIVCLLIAKLGAILL